MSVSNVCPSKMSVMYICLTYAGYYARNTIRATLFTSCCAAIMVVQIFKITFSLLSYIYAGTALIDSRLAMLYEL